MVAINPDESITVPQMTLEHLLAETSAYLSPHDLEKVRDAFELANHAHMGVVRRSGDPYIQHPLEVALLLADMRIDADGIASALLHDVVEDTDFTLDDLRKRFGNAVANIVDGVTKFDALASNQPAPKDKNAPETPEQIEQRQRQARDLKRRQRTETVRKMLLAMAEDPRVVVLKLADRLHNMRTLSVMNPVQQQNTARETNEIYAPLARRLGMSLVQADLEDLVFSYLDPDRYASLAREVEEEHRKRLPYIEQTSRMLREEMERAGISAEVQAWQKHLASIERKLEQNGGELSQIHDFVSFRILVDSVHDCYLALGHIHALWRPKDGRIKDFVATPKLNGYQSLHTTVFCLENQLAEIQIRTHEMQRIADYGIASYWYMKDRGGTRLSTHEMIAWIEQLRDWQRELPQNADEFVEAVKGDIFQEQIFVFTPKGEVKDLPRGSTPLDMAYRIHTNIGDHCAGARIVTNMEENGRLVTRIVPLDYELKGGEIVDIRVNNTAHPTRNWLSFARTTTARTKIRRYLKTYEREVNLQLGRERLDLAIKGMGASGIKTVQNDDLAKFSAPKKYLTPDDLFIALGRAELPVMSVVDYLTPLLQSRGEIKIADSIESRKQSLTQSCPESATPLIMVKLAHCCCPLPGDAITGLVNPSKGILVHRSDCRTLRRYRGQESERLIEVNWLQIEAQHYLVPIIIVARDRPGLLRDVAVVVSDANINMTAVTSTTNFSVQRAIITASLEIHSLDQIEPIFDKLKQVKNVVSVTRDLGHRAN
ncbi:MAG: bifunctional (p)ppGpp synthetase/guanosine-3',5'-bis(diphosphate) 3'-pyrophosphohydrolase [Ktedonobacteraceae bacterium]